MRIQEIKIIETTAGEKRSYWPPEASTTHE
jgi:hypothetical protein